MKINKCVCFKNRYDLQQRLQKFKKQQKQDSSKIPIIVEPQAQSSLPFFTNPRFCMSKQKDLLYMKMTLMQKIEQIPKSALKPHEGIFFYVGKKIISQSSQSIANFYQKHKDSDGFLYITYSQLECF